MLAIDKRRKALNEFAELYPEMYALIMKFADVAYREVAKQEGIPAEEVYFRKVCDFVSGVLSKKLTDSGYNARVIWYYGCDVGPQEFIILEFEGYYWGLDATWQQFCAQHDPAKPVLIFRIGSVKPEFNIESIYNTLLSVGVPADVVHIWIIAIFGDAKGNQSYIDSDSSVLRPQAAIDRVAPSGMAPRWLRPRAAIDRMLQGGTTADANTNVKNVMQHHGVVFIHSIRPDVVPSSNSLLEKGTDWVTKLKVVLSFRPVLSTSTLQKGDGSRNMWGTMGVFLNGGEVLNAYSHDRGTVAHGICLRGEKQEDVMDNIPRAIQTRRVDRYNEFVVARPQIAGFYICKDEEGFRSNPTRVSDEGINTALQSLGASTMPLFIIQDGKFYIAHYNSTTRTIVRDEEIGPSQILETHFQPSEAEIDRMQRELLENPPFRTEAIGTEKTRHEAMCIDARDFDGRHAYIALNMKKYPRSGVIAHFTTRLSRQVEYSVEENRFVEKRYNRFGSEIWTFDNCFVSPIRGGPSFERTVRDNEGYFSEMRHLINEGRTKDYGDILEIYAFRLYGFAEEAAKLGDDENYNKAIAIASQIVSEDEYRDMIQRRVGMDGQFMLTMEDLYKTFGTVSSAKDAATRVETSGVNELLLSQVLRPRPYVGRTKPTSEVGNGSWYLRPVAAGEKSIVGIADAESAFLKNVKRLFDEGYFITFGFVSPRNFVLSSLAAPLFFKEYNTYYASVIVTIHNDDITRFRKYDDKFHCKEGSYEIMKDENNNVLSLDFIYPELPGEGQGYGRTFIGASLILLSSRQTTETPFVIKNTSEKMADSFKELPPYFHIRVTPYERNATRFNIEGIVPRLDEAVIDEWRRLNETNRMRSKLNIVINDNQVLVSEPHLIFPTKESPVSSCLLRPMAQRESSRMPPRPVAATDKIVPSGMVPKGVKNLKEALVQCGRSSKIHIWDCYAGCGFYHCRGVCNGRLRRESRFCTGGIGVFA